MHCPPAATGPSMGRTPGLSSPPTLCTRTPKGAARSEVGPARQDDALPCGSVQGARAYVAVTVTQRCLRTTKLAWLQRPRPPACRCCRCTAHPYDTGCTKCDAQGRCIECSDPAASSGTTVLDTKAGRWARRLPVVQLEQADVLKCLPCSLQEPVTALTLTDRPLAHLQHAGSFAHVAAGV